MGDDTSDILATNNVPIVRGSPSGRWSGLSFGIKSTFILAVILALYVASRRLWESLLLWREKSYKLYVSVLFILFLNLRLDPSGRCDGGMAYPIMTTDPST